MTGRIKVGLLGLGRLGKVYAHILASRIPESTLAAVADKDPSRVDRIQQEVGPVDGYTDSSRLINDPGVEAVVIVTPTSTHCDLITEAVVKKKAVFCEKPISISLKEAEKAHAVLNSAGAYFQMGFMRRFDPGYASAKAKIERGRIGRPVLFKSTSRDPFPPSVEYADPEKSGGLILDMGIHDIDLARWFFGEVENVYAEGALLACSELAKVNDIDNAVLTLRFTGGGLGLIDLSRKGVYGYDISTEILGTEGALRVGYLRETPLLELMENHVGYDVVPYFPQRFEKAFYLQLKNFIENLAYGRQSPVTIEDGIEALRVGIAATQAQYRGRPVHVRSVASDSDVLGSL
jgi:inositol 2-dehydrogenase